MLTRVEREALAIVEEAERHSWEYAEIERRRYRLYQQRAELGRCVICSESLPKPLEGYTSGAVCMRVACSGAWKKLPEEAQDAIYEIVDERVRRQS